MKFRIIPRLIISFAVLGLAMIFQSCGSSKLPVATDFSDEENSSPKIVFLTCLLAYDSVRQNFSMALVSKQVVEGKIKESHTIGQGRGDFSYRILNTKRQPISQKYMACPLDKDVEYVDEQGNLQRKYLRLNSAEVFLRLQLTPETHYIAFDKLGKQLLLINLRK